MQIASAEIKLHANDVNSLKDKRMIVRSLIDKVSHKFNVSIGEVDDQDTHQIIVLGVACVSGSKSKAEEIMNEVVGFIEGSTDADVTDIKRDYYKSGVD